MPPRERTLEALSLLREREELRAQKALQRAIAEQSRTLLRVEQARDALAQHRRACRERSQHQAGSQTLTGFALQQAERHREGMRLREQELAARLRGLEAQRAPLDAAVRDARRQLAQRHAERQVVERRRDALRDGHSA